MNFSDLNDVAKEVTSFITFNLFVRKMPPKGKDAKKGAPQGNYKAGKPLKDILPANMKAPREGTVVKLDGEPSV